MNNGQTEQSLDTTGAPTPNLVEISTNQNIASLDNMPGGQANWAPEHDNKSIGNKVIFSNETHHPDKSIERVGSPENLGGIVDLNPAVLQPNQPARSDASSVFVINEDLIRVEDGHLSKGAMSEMKKLKFELDQTGNMGNFYVKARGMMEMMKKNLENSHNGKLAS